MSYCHLKCVCIKQMKSTRVAWCTHELFGRNEVYGERLNCSTAYVKNGNILNTSACCYQPTAGKLIVCLLLEKKVKKIL